MLTTNRRSERERVELESRVLAAAFKQSLDLGDGEAAYFVHRQLFQLLRAQRPSVVKSTSPGTVLPAAASAAPPAAPALPNGLSSAPTKATPSPPPQPMILPEAWGDLMPPPEPAPNAAPLAPADAAVQDLANLFAQDIALDFGNGDQTYQAPLTQPPPAQPPMPTAPKEQQPVNTVSKPKAAPPPTTETRTQELSHEHKLEVAGLISEIAAAKDIYGMLGVSQYASYEQIHKNFMKRARRLLMFKSPQGGYPRHLLDGLRSIWIAHDILVSPKTRNDYDFRVLGLKSKSESVTEVKPTRSPTRMSKIGELFEASGLLEPTELQIACDMHKAMPEMQFGRFLVKQGFLEEAQLQAVLAAQRLIRTGKLTLSQFKEAMSIVNNREGTFSQVLLKKGFCSKDDLALIERIESETARKIPVDAPTGRDIAAGSLSKIAMGKSEYDDDDLALDEITGDHQPLPPKPEPKPVVKPKRNPLSESFSGKPAAKPGDSVQREIKITHQRLHSMIEDYESRINTRVGYTDIGETTFGEIDRIDTSEIDPEAGGNKKE
jgi:hypothetical protein